MTTTGAAVATIPGANDDAAATTTTEQPGIIAASGSGEFMATIGIIGGASIVALGLVAICCRWLIKFTSDEQREIRRKAEFEALQREQERLQKALLEMNSTEAATQKRAQREKQKLVEKMEKQEEIRVRNERMKTKRLKELAYELKKQGTGIVIEGFDDSDDDDVPGAPNAAAAAAKEEEQDADAEAAKEAAEKARARREKQEKLKAELNPDAEDPDEGEAITALPPPAYANDATFFRGSRVDEAAARGRLLPAVEQQKYHKPWEAPAPPRQRFVPGLAVRRVIPPTGDECPKAPVVVYDEEKDDFVYISHEENQRRLAEDRARAENSANAKDKLERDKARKGIVQTGEMNFDEVDESRMSPEEKKKLRLPGLPELQKPWTENAQEQPLARARTGVRASSDVQLQKARFVCEELE